MSDESVRCPTKNESPYYSSFFFLEEEERNRERMRKKRRRERGVGVLNKHDALLTWSSTENCEQMRHESVRALVKPPPPNRGKKQQKVRTF